MIKMCIIGYCMRELFFMKNISFLKVDNRIHRTIFSAS